MRYFDLRGLLPQPDQPATVALPVFDSIPAPSATTAPASLVHDRPTSPNLLAQLDAAANHPPDTVILSLLDGDATLRLNTALAARNPETLLDALDHLAGRFNPQRVWILLDATAPSNWLAPLRDAVRTRPDPRRRPRLIPLRNDYPESGPTLLLFALLKRKLKPGRFPTDVGVLLLDAPAMLTALRLARDGASPAVVPCALHHPESTHFVEIPAGATLTEVLAHYNLRPEHHTLRGGDLLRDQRVDGDYRIGPGHLTFYVHPPERPVNPDPCVRCGWCYEGCPTRIHPAALLEAAQQQSLKMAAHAGLDACIECGICAYVCPSHLPILTGIRTLRDLPTG